MSNNDILKLITDHIRAAKPDEEGKRGIEINYELVDKLREMFNPVPVNRIWVKSNHAPGPWTIDFEPIGPMSNYFAAEVESEMSCVCSVWCNGEREISLANARLIQAAPEMYDLLVELANSDGWTQITFQERVEALLTRINTPDHA